MNVTDVHTVRSQSLASKLYVTFSAGCAHNVCVASVSSDVPLSTAVLRAIDVVKLGFNWSKFTTMSSVRYAVGDGFDNGGAGRAASGCNVRVPHIRSIEKFITIIETTDNGRIYVEVEVTSVGLAHSCPITQSAIDKHLMLPTENVSA